MMHRLFIAIPIIFMVETMAMLVFHKAPHSLERLVVLDVVTLIVIVLPLLYWLLVRPLDQKIKKLNYAETALLQSEKELQKKSYDLGERVKELNCLSKMSELVFRSTTLEEIFGGVVDIIPAAFQFPFFTCAQITIAGQEYKSGEYDCSTWEKTSDIIVHEKQYGVLRICSTEGNFLKEEGNLLDIIAKRLGRIVERIQAGDQIKADLKEKQTLLDEIHHRVKNNMAIIIGLLKLQANATDDKHIKEALEESQSRVYAMSVIHGTLCGSENMSEIPLENYLKNISRTIHQTYSLNKKIKLHCSIDDTIIQMDNAFSIGLVINELITNSLKYAFPSQAEGNIYVDAKTIDGDLELIVSDDGVGMPREVDWKTANTLGLKLVRTLIDQLDGKIIAKTNIGTWFHMSFAA